MKYEFVAPCYFGIESAAAYDFKRIGAQEVRVTDGRIHFVGDEEILAKANLWSRCAERVMICLGRFAAPDFDALFDGVFSLPLEEYIPANGRFPVKGSSLSSTLSSVPACQSIVKKAAVERLRKGHGVQILEENTDEYRLRFSIRKDMAEVFLDTSGAGLHKRGYRKTAGVAPLKETLAAAISDIGHVKRDTVVQDPFCGSGTLVIEAAMKARNIAPGLHRPFAAESYAFLPKDLFAKARAQAREEEKPDATFEGLGTDIDPAMVQLATANARKAGVGGCCRFGQEDARRFVPGQGALVLANPPYGERLMEAEQAAELVKAFGKALFQKADPNACILAADEEFERNIGRKARKKRKVYNGMIPCQLYLYYQ
ncbi:class I SAM-dependent RNA methyltransferase [Ruminococcaceae bacterium OttesenSCG-928-I18]|nr:class I SAM-dependent RNA methyltransferase [Ruminococcaceae bacterium OttesenSCG-928-I18]